jgi:outer membrane protein OmpA-like peptidoglycan-associated protein
MKILLIGFLTFCIWSFIATNIYVCKIMGFCDDLETKQIVDPKLSEEITADTLKITLSQQPAVAPKDLIIYFDFDKSEFASNSTTEKYVEESKIYLNQNSQTMLSITGYTDAIGSNDYNQALGYRRAQRMLHYFESNGVPPPKITIESYGEKEPAADNNTIEGRAKNRRPVMTIKN